MKEHLTSLEKAEKEAQKLNSFIEKERNRLHKKKIKAITSEGTREDILNTNITGKETIGSNQKKNIYKTYKDTTQAMYEMYNNTKDFGGEFLRSIISTRVAFIAGGGITVIAKKDIVAKSINNFLKDNRLLQGSKLFSNVSIGELEGKDLMVLKPDNTIGQVLVRNFYNVSNPYFVSMEEKDNQVIKEVIYKSEDENKDQKIADLSHLVFVKLGGTPDKVNETMPKVGNCLSDVENASRIKWDLRFNNHLYGRLTPVFETENKADAQALNNTLVNEDWKIGKAYCGTAKFSIIGPPPGATEALKEELIIACRIISINTGIPIHWLAWPELMSNRSTAETLLEVINSATVEERETWTESFTELVLKAGRIAFLRGYESWPFNIDKEEFEIRLPLISLAMLKQIQETYIPLAEMGYISKDSVRNKIPGIDPLMEKKLIEKQDIEQVKSITNKFKNNFGQETENVEEE